MKITLLQVFNLFRIDDPLKPEESLISKLYNFKFDIKTSFTIKQIMRKLSPFYEDLEEQKNKLIKEMGESIKSENGSEVFRVKKENMSAFIEKFNELLAKEIEVDLNQIELEQIKDFKLNVIESDRIEFIIKQ